MLSTVKKFTLTGFIFGLCFPLLAIVIDLEQNTLSFSWANIQQLYKNNLLHCIITSAPFILGCMAYFLARNQEELEINIINSIKQATINNTVNKKPLLLAIEKEITRLLTEKIKQIEFQKKALDEHSIVSITDAKGTITYANAKFEEISQYSRAELIGQNHRILKSDHHPDAFFNAMWKTLINGQTWHGEIQNKAKDGTLYWVASTIVPYLNQQGKPEQYIAIRTDITSVKNNTERLNFALRATGDAVWDWNIETGQFILSNMYAEMLGYQANELPLTIDTWINSVHPDDLAYAQETLQAYLSGKTLTYQVEIRLLCKDNSWKWIHCRGQIIDKDKQGNPLTMTGFHSDISARKAMEAELLQEKETAEKANQAKSEFLSSMSHELRTPLNAILGFAQLMEDNPEEPLSEEQQENIEFILSSGEHLLNLINDILELAAIEAKKVDLQIKSIILSNALTDAISLLKPIAAKTNIVINDITEDLNFTVLADSIKLKQVLLNLISNAIKYNKPNGTISLNCETINNTHVRINVCDTGIGIPENQQQKLFTAFNRLGQENSNIEGTGIGLLVTKELVEMMHGTLGFESIEAQGSCFWFELPLSSTKNLSI